MRETQGATLSQQTLDEEGEADKKLTRLAEGVVNVEAAAANGSEGAAVGKKRKAPARGKK